MSDPLLHVNGVTGLEHLLLRSRLRKSQPCIPEARKAKLKKSRRRMDAAKRSVRAVRIARTPSILRLDDFSKQVRASITRRHRSAWVGKSKKEFFGVYFFSPIESNILRQDTFENQSVVICQAIPSCLINQCQNLDQF